MKCPECDENGFKDARHLGRHRRFVHGVIGKKNFKRDGVTPRKDVYIPQPALPPVKDFTCPECGKELTNARGYGYHRRMAHGIPGKTAKYNAIRMKRKHDLVKADPIPRIHQTKSPNGFPLQFIGHFVGYLEGMCHQEAYKHNLPARLFTQDVAEYFLAKTKIGE